MVIIFFASAEILVCSIRVKFPQFFCDSSSSPRSKIKDSVIFDKYNLINFPFYNAVLNNQQIKGPKRHASIAY